MGKDNYLNRVELDGIDLGFFDQWKGGKGDSQVQTYNPAGTGGQVTRGGRKTRENITVGREYIPERDQELVRQLDSRRGKARGTAIRQPGDTDGNPFGSPYVYDVLLKSVSPSDTDTNASGIDMFELELVPQGNDIG